MATSPKSKQLSITLKRSPIGTPYTHRLVLRGLGLRNIRQTVVRPDNPQVQGLIHKVSYLLDVKDATLGNQLLNAKVKPV